MMRYSVSFCGLLMAIQVAASVNEVADYGDVRLRGPYAAKLDKLLENQVWHTDATYLARAFRRRQTAPGSWATEFWGKFMHSAMPFSLYRRNDAFLRNVDRGVDSILAVQEDSGYVGNYADDVRLDVGWDIWGIKYTLMGLLHYYDGCLCRDGETESRVRRRERAILAARRLCDYLIREIGPGGHRNRELHRTGEWSGLPSCSLLEPVVWLYALAAADSIVRDEITLAGSGSSSEIWCHGKARQHLPFMQMQETCVTTTWMRFAEKLLTVTGDPRWADELERSFYNAYLAAINPEYTEFSSCTPMSGYRMRGGDSCQMHVNCCSMNGPRGYLSFLRGCIQSKGNRIFYNFYTSGSQRILLPSAKAFVEFDSFTYYPRENEVTIVYAGEADMNFTLAIRIPRWSQKTVVSVNGQKLGAPKAGTYYDIDRRWQNGDEVKLALDMSVCAHLQDHHVAFTRGPVLLARDSRFCDGRVDEVIPPASWAFADVEPFKTPGFEAVFPTFRGVDMAFAAEMTMGVLPHGRKHSVHFCDFASAGNTWSPDNVYCTWLPFERMPTEKQ